VRALYDHTDVALAEAWVDETIRDVADPEMPLEVPRLGRTIKRWRGQIVAWHSSHVSNGPTEAINSLVKRVRRGAFGRRAFGTTGSEHCSTPPDPTPPLLDTLTPP